MTSGCPNTGTLPLQAHCCRSIMNAASGHGARIIRSTGIAWAMPNRLPLQRQLISVKLAARIRQTFPPPLPLTPASSLRERTFLLTVAGIQFTHILDFMIMMPLGPQLIRALQIDTHQFGLLLSSYTFTAAASSLLAATYIDRFDRRRLMLSL